MKKAVGLIIGIAGFLIFLLGCFGLYTEVVKILNDNPDDAIFIAFLLIGVGLILMRFGFKLYKKANIPASEAESIQNRSRRTYRNLQKPANTEKPPSASPKTIQSATSLNNIFLSYRRSDSADVTGRIYDKLIQTFAKKQIFKDVDSIPLGVDFRQHLNKKVGECNVLIAIIGAQWIEPNVPKGQKRIDDEKDFVRIEIESALQRKIPVIPVLVRGAQMPAVEDLPESLIELAFRNGIPVRPDPDFHRDMERLIQGIKHHI